MKSCISLLLILNVFIFSVAAAPTLPPRARSLTNKPIRLVIAKELVAPNGIAREGITVNGQTPGPTFTFAQDDDVEFEVLNNLDEDTAVHFHGIEQRGTPWSDGVPGVSQRPIAPGQSFLYQWKASQSGAFWYHSHYKGQISDGLHGTIIINPRNGTDKPFHLIARDETEVQQLENAERKSQVVALADWTNFTYQEVMDIEYASGVDYFCIDSLTINGKGKNICKPQEELNELERPNQLALTKTKDLTLKGCLPAGKYQALHPFPYDLSKLPKASYDECYPSENDPAIIEVDPKDGWASLTIISASPATLPVFTIDNHSMWIYAVDGPYIYPTFVNGLQAPASKRYQVFVKLDQQPGDYTIRVPSLTGSQIISGYGVFRYKGVEGHNRTAVEGTPWVGYNGLNVTSPFITNDDMTLRPYPHHKPAATAQRTFIFDAGFFHRDWQWTLSGKAAINDTYDAPALFDPNPDQDLVFETEMDEWVDIIIRVPNGQTAHPIHKHSNKFYAIGKGYFYFNYTSVAEAMEEHPEAFNLEDPPWADTIQTPQTRMGPGFLALRYHVENPGAFMMHCHIQTHLDGGMGVVFLDAMSQVPPIPQVYLDAEKIGGRG
ncbi:hypothetical protein KEM56_000470 [Ascosphaera pollenicola]|nr:hypothetical protein KEM56_000470 [Ascosphaera pollenicola]